MPNRAWQPLLLCAATLAASGTATAKQPEAAAAAAEADLPCQSVQVRDGLTVYRGCRGGPAATDATTFLNSYGQALGLVNGLGDLELVETRHGLTGTVSVYQQLYTGLPVHEARVMVQSSNGDRVQTVSSGYRPIRGISGSSQATISRDQAEQRALTGLTDTVPEGKGNGKRALDLPLTVQQRLPSRAEQVWVVDDPTAGTVRLAWRLHLYTDQPLGDWLVLVDAGDGRLLYRANRLATAGTDTPADPGNGKSDAGRAPPLVRLPGGPCRALRNWEAVAGADHPGRALGLGRAGRVAAVVDRGRAVKLPQVFQNCDFPGDRTFPEAAARQLIDSHGRALGLGRNSQDLARVQVRQGLRSAHTRFEQTWAGYPVWNAYVSVHQGASGKIRQVNANYRATLRKAGSRQASLSPGQAQAIALEALGGDKVRLRLPGRQRLVWFPLDDSGVTLAWELMVYAEQPLGDYLTLVDAGSGELLLQEDRLARQGPVTGSGWAFFPNPVQTSGNTALTDGSDGNTPALDGQLFELDLLGLDPGTGLLQGEFVDVTGLPTSFCPQCSYPNANEPSRIYHYNRSDLRFEQVNVYHAIDAVQRYIHDLGFDDDQGVPNGIRDYPTLANVHWYRFDQSFYSPGDDGVHFGDGGVDDAEDADIVVHEYGHAIQYFQNSCWGGGEMMAMGEGFGDYLAAAFFADQGDAAYQAAHGACVAEWDGTSYRTTVPACLRRVDGNKRYPDDWTGEEHEDGEIWSAALWQLRQAINGPTLDQILLEHHFSLPCNATLPMAALEMINVDQLLSGGVNGPALRTAFCDRGILSGDDCLNPGGNTVVLEAVADSFIGQQSPDYNEGANPQLRLRGRVLDNGDDHLRRVVVGFDLGGIDLTGLTSATLVLSVVDDKSQYWGGKGKTVDAHPLIPTMAEGNGRNEGLGPGATTPGHGSGVTWNCGTDTDISNSLPDCIPTWNGGHYGEALAAPVVHTNDMTGTVSWGVTDDVLAGTRAWLVRKTDESLNGRVFYHAREGALAAGDATLAPRLVLTFAGP